MPHHPFDRSEIPLSPDIHFESALWADHCFSIAGIDEAGRGAWAGPVYAGAVILPPDPEIVQRLHHVRDSKQMSPLSREFWANEIKNQAAAWGVGSASHQEIDELGIVPATRLAMMRALSQLAQPTLHLLLDAMLLPEVDLPQTSLIKGDARSLSIAAASVLAKTSRDAWMVQMDERYPGYGFARHKGYGTAVHRAALQDQGPCPIHRFSFSPVHLLQIKEEN
jgi:ribonuclease HII